MFSRRDFILCQFRSEKEPDDTNLDGDVREEDSPEEIQAIGSDFSDEMLFREMMRMGKDPSNMNREQMLHTVLVEMRT